MKKINKKELHELFVELKNKNQDAYNKLYENYYSLVYGIVFSIIKNKEDSEDVSHEIFTKVYKLPVDKLPSNNEASWLYTVSKNESFLYLRKSKPNISLDEVYEIPSDSNDIDVVIDSEFYNKIMSGLEEDEKMIVSLKVLSGFTFQKIAQIMNIPMGTVQWKYYKAINSLKISIGSLAGAVISFLIVLASGGLWKKEKYLNKNDNNGNENNTQSNLKQNAEASTNENLVKSEMLSNDEKTNEVDVPKADEKKEIIEIPASQSQQIVKNMNAVQVAFSSIGIVLLIIFVIFFKKYQQKLKRK